MIDTIGSRIKQLRMGTEMSQNQLAKLVNVKRSTISLYEADQRQPPSGTMVQIAKVFHVTTDYLLGCQHEEIIVVTGLSREEIGSIQALVEHMLALHQRADR